MDPIKQLNQLIKEAKQIVVFTGAGISTESGVSDYRSQGGIWERFQPVTIQEFLGSHWGEVWPFAITRDEGQTVYYDPGMPPQLGPMSPSDAAYTAWHSRRCRRKKFPATDLLVAVLR